MEIHVFSAPGDGIDPAVMLTIGQRPKTQYLINVPEGFSRYVLEHKVRPGLGLRAVFCSDLVSATGLSGLIMRLRGEGHGYIELMGPGGTFQFVTSLQHFVHWRNPAVLMTEIARRHTHCNLPVYSDESVTASAIWPGSNCPVWLSDLAGKHDTTSQGHCEGGNTEHLVENEEKITPNESLHATSSSETSKDENKNKAHVKESCSLATSMIKQYTPGLCKSEKNCILVHGRAYSPLNNNQGVGGMVSVYRRCDVEEDNPSVSGLQSHSGSTLSFIFHISTPHINSIILYLHCHTAEDVESWARHPVCNLLKNTWPQGRLLATIVRIPPLLSGSSSCVRRLLENLPPHASVYVVHPTGPGAPPTLGFLSSARIMARLNLVSQRMFPLPACLLSKSPPESRTVPRDQSSSLCHERSVCTLDRLTCLVWESNNNLVSVHADDHMGSKSDLNQESLRDRLLLADPSLKQRLDALGRAFPVLNKRGEMREGAHGEAKRQKISNRKAAAVLKARLSGVQFPDGKKDEEEGEFEPEIVFLGTGSAEPSKYRGASAVYVCLDGYECVRGEIRWRQDHVPGFLLDCGEGTWGQLVRHLGPTQALKVVLSLGFIWISHRHADHMSGILRIIEIHSQGMAGVGRKVIEAKQQRPLLIIGPNALGSWLQKAVPAMLGIENPSSVIRFVHCGDIVDDSRPKSPSVRAVCLSSGLTSLRCVPMRHCSDAWGLVVGHETGWSLAYSGDTEPCDALVQAGQGVSVLIHEATFEPALQAEARRKKHSTTSEALSIAQKMHPRATILTHFSQRYPKFPEGINTDDSTLETRQIAVAFDGMHLPLSCIPALSALTKCVEVLLALNSDPDDGQKLRGL